MFCLGFFASITTFVRKLLTLLQLIWFIVRLFPLWLLFLIPVCYLYFNFLWQNDVTLTRELSLILLYSLFFTFFHFDSVFLLQPSCEEKTLRVNEYEAQSFIFVVILSSVIFTCFKAIAVFLFYIFVLYDEENLGGGEETLEKQVLSCRDRCLWMRRLIML